MSECCVSIVAIVVACGPVERASEGARLSRKRHWAMMQGPDQYIEARRHCAAIRDSLPLDHLVPN
jgi:hypothetical protein